MESCCKGQFLHDAGRNEKNANIGESRENT
jgi:hypothetical protein